MARGDGRNGGDIVENHTSAHPADRSGCGALHGRGRPARACPDRSACPGPRASPVLSCPSARATGVAEGRAAWFTCAGPAPDRGRWGHRPCRVVEGGWAGAAGGRLARGLGDAPVTVTVAAW